MAEFQSMGLARALNFFFCLMLAAQFAGCGSPVQRLEERAANLGYRRVVVPGNGFEHVAYIKRGRTNENSVLHVYLDGDGSPWLRKQIAAVDPTPRIPTMLELMSLDPAPSIYLGRPCYHGLNKTEACTPEIWTAKRYSEAVVSSMSDALNGLSAGYSALVLLGYSGGGTLAMLMAERLPNVKAVVTVAANLDTVRWVEMHKLQPLTGSLNPAARPPLSTRIRQMHIAGGRDDNVPTDLIREAISRQQGAQFAIFPDQDHACCWLDVWDEILGGLEAH